MWYVALKKGLEKAQSNGRLFSLHGIKGYQKSELSRLSEQESGSEVIRSLYFTNFSQVLSNRNKVKLSQN